MTHPFAIAGLILNAIGTVLLVLFPPQVQGYTKDGYMISGGGAFSELPKNRYQQLEWKAKYWWRANISRASFVLMCVGFILQLVDLLYV